MLSFSSSCFSSISFSLHSCFFHNSLNLLSTSYLFTFHLFFRMHFYSSSSSYFSSLCFPLHSYLSRHSLHLHSVLYLLTFYLFFGMLSTLPPLLNPLPSVSRPPLGTSHSLSSPSYPPLYFLLLYLHRFVTPSHRFPPFLFTPSGIYVFYFSLPFFIL